MYNRYHGNTGRMERVEENGQSGAPSPAPARRPPPQAKAKLGPPAPKPGLPGLAGQLGRIFPGTEEPLETEDLILLLILYLLYRESGDSELLMIMGGMFLL